MRSRTRVMTSEQNAMRDEGSAKVIRLTRPSVVVLCGPAACGKSTFAARHFRPTQIISSDQARGLVCDDERDQRFQAQAFALLHCLIEQRLSINRLCVVDSTALTTSARQSLLELGRRYRVPAVVLLLDVPLETCLDHDAKRERTVGRQVIERQYQLFAQAKSAIKQEGFEQVIELGGEDLDKVQIEIVFRPVPRAVTEGAPPDRPRVAPLRSQPPAANKGDARDVEPPSPPSTGPSS